jgi:hypothetical protein
MLYNIWLSKHAEERAVERFKALHIVCDDDKGYIDLALSAVNIAVNNRFMEKYLRNMFKCSKRYTEDVLVYDEVNKMVYALAIKTDTKKVIVKTIGTEKDGTEWLYDNRHQKLCWIYEKVFVFSTANGNVTWY